MYLKGLHVLNYGGRSMVSNGRVKHVFRRVNMYSMVGNQWERG